MMNSMKARPGRLIPWIVAAVIFLLTIFSYFLMKVASRSVTLPNAPANANSPSSEGNKTARTPVPPGFHGPTGPPPSY